MVELADGRVAFWRCSFMFLPFVKDARIFNFLCSHFPRFVMLYLSFRLGLNCLDLLADEEVSSRICWPVRNDFCCRSFRSL